MYGTLIARHMRFNAFASLLTLTFLILFLMIAPAAAAPVDLSPAYTYINQFLPILLAGLAIALSAWIVWAFHTRVRPFLEKYVAPAILDRIEQKAASALNTALQNGIAIAMNKVEAVEQQHATVDVKNDWAAQAASYTLKFAPDAVAKFGLTPEDLALKALAYVPVAPATTLGTTGNVDPVKPVEQRGLPPLT